ncbi:Ribonuclease P protein subunit p21 [Coemansia helicoidea]|uniref:Ribonuclease P protein subunit p21 n=1 Tax=Coemansia helicoidea TaxID=1286919 RepID=A0ACC1L003_9FUNG|nr:Ribonuclease P protein subunit p21 [Coemansia helicoidea]
MGKRTREPQPGVLPNRELFQRLNFLLQSSQFFASLPGASHTHSSVAEGAAVAPPGCADPPLLPLARFYAKEMRQVAQKSVLRLSPHVKRGICQVCSSPLVPGVSAAVRVKGKGRGQRVLTTCTYCGHQARLMVNSNHVLFVDRPEHGTIRHPAD